MPEGPEIRRSADDLSELLFGQVLINAFVGKHGRYTSPHEPPKGFDDFIDKLSRHGSPTIDEVNCKGKFMWWTLTFPKCEQLTYLWITYGMSGQWTPEESPYTTFGIYYNSTGLPDSFRTLYFNDVRHFGTLKFVDDDKEHARKLASLGPDMLSAPPNQDEFDLRLMKRVGKTIAEALMDQSVVSGVGNYVKAEALYLSELSPHRLVSSLKPQERARLRDQIINVVKASYATGGATLSTYKNPDGSRGEAQRRFAVYGNKTDPMGNPVVREETKDGRTTHWVPSVQR